MTHDWTLGQDKARYKVGDKVQFMFHGSWQIGDVTQVKYSEYKGQGWQYYVRSWAGAEWYSQRQLRPYAADTAPQPAGRCSQCGGPLQELPRDPGQTQRVYKCTSCNRVFWS